MDIFDFFNSPDVAEHCRKIGCTFNAVESAVIINQNDTHTLAEKHIAYKTILAEYPDMEANGFLLGPIESFHEELRNLLKNEERLIGIFLTTEPGAFYKTYTRCRNGNHDYFDEEYFSTYIDALAKVKEDVDKRKEDNKDIYEYFIEKKYLGVNNKWINVSISPSGDILNFSENGYWK